METIKQFEEELGCRIGVAVLGADPSMPSVDHRGHELFHAASTMKLPVLIEVYRQAEQGLFSLDDTVLFDPMCRSFIDGSLFECDAGPNLRNRLNQQVPIRELAREMMIVSDNLATNLLIELCGYRNINATMRSLGVQRDYVIRGVQDEEAFQAGMSNRATPRGLTTLLAAVDQGRAASADACAEMKQVLLDQRYRTMIPAGVPDHIAVGNKTGSISATRHDTGIVYAPFGTYYITILIDGLKEPDRGIRAGREISRLVYQEMEDAAQAAKR